MRSERSSNRNKAITFLPNSWVIRQEHWSEWRAHKMCIADCLQCSLGLVWREERSQKHCRSMCASVQTVVSHLPFLSPLVLLIWTKNKGNLYVCTEPPKEGEWSSKQWENLAHRHALFYLILPFSAPSSCVLLRLQCPQDPDSSSHRDMFGWHKANDY